MTTKKITEKPVELTEEATEEVQGGRGYKLTDVLVSGVKDDNPKSSSSFDLEIGGLPCDS